MADYYQLLGVSRDAGAEEIKKAYRKLAMRYHPDRNSDDDAEERFTQVTEAWEVLRDPEKRALYDRHGEAGLRRGAGGGEPFSGFGNFSDAFEVFMREFGGGGLGDLFGGGPAQDRTRRGSSLRVSLEITLEEAARGVQKSLRIAVMEPCERCDARGAEPGSHATECTTCGGVGEVRMVQRSMLGQFVSVRPCPDCGGQGSRIEAKCRDCDASGRVRTQKTVELDIPAGISAEDYLKLRERGNVGPRGGPAGDLIVRVEIQPDDRFERRGDDLILDLPVTFSQAALGTDLEVPTILGLTRLSVPAGVQGGQVLRLRGEGMPRLRASGRGDQLVRIHVWTPSEISHDQRAAFEALAAVEDAAPVPGRGEDPSFWQRVKAAFTA